MNPDSRAAFATYTNPNHLEYDMEGTNPTGVRNLPTGDHFYMNEIISLT